MSIDEKREGSRLGQIPILGSLEEIRADILALERESEGLLGEIIGEGD